MIGNSVVFPPLPRQIDVEPTINCNFGCIMCQRTYWTRRAKDMTIHQFKHVINSFPNLERVKLQGIGEPLLNRDFFQMVEYCISRSIEVSTYTNGSLLHLLDRSQRLLDSGIRLIRISLDGATKSTFEKVRVGADFEQVVSNVANLVQLRGTMTDPRIELWMVGMNHNLQEITDLVRLAKSIGVDAVNIQLVLNTFSYKDEVGTSLTDQMIARNSDTRPHLREAEQLANQLGVDLILQTSKAYSTKRKCHWPFDRAYISVEGHVVPCCTIADPRVASMGNIFEEPFSAIWRGQRYQQFRLSILRHELLAPCRNCYATDHQSLITAIEESQPFDEEYPEM